MRYLVITSVLLIGGCDMSMPGKDIQRAIDLCEPNGGVDKLTTKIDGARLQCKNGAYFIIMYDD